MASVNLTFGRSGGQPPIEAKQPVIKSHMIVALQTAQGPIAAALLFMLGDELVHIDIAQQSGKNPWNLAPVPFSFGWPVYIFNVLSSATARTGLLPPPEFPVIVTSIEDRCPRDNTSWVVCRLLRDLEKSPPAAVNQRMDKVLKDAGRKHAGLCISVYKVGSKKAGVPDQDTLWYSGLHCSATQCLLAVVPWLVSGDHEIFDITTLGTMAAYLTASIPYYGQEKTACRENTKKTFVLTRGNGAQHAVVIIGAGRGLDIEDLARAGEEPHERRALAKTFILPLVAWFYLLIQVCAVKDNIWYLIAIGFLGMMHHAVIAGMPRDPGAYGIHLDYESVFMQPKVMATLKEAAEAYPGVGQSLLKTFFPGELRPDDVQYWKQARKVELEKHAVKKARAGKECNKEAGGKED